MKLPFRPAPPGISLFDPAYLVTSGMLTGNSPLISGTVGSAAAVVVWAAAAVLMPTAPVALLLSLVTTVVGAVACRQILSRLTAQGADARWTDDPGYIVIDEWAGMFLTLIPIQHGDWMGAAAAFLLFRILDILKPGPVDWVQRLPGMWGIMLDDLLAGLLGWGVLTLAYS